MKVILRFLKPHKQLCFITIFLAFIDVLGALIIPTYAAEMLNLGTMQNADFSLIAVTCLKMLIAAVISGAAMIVASYFCSDLTSKVAADMRNEIYKKTLTLSGSDFHTFGTASVTTRTVSDITNIQFALGNCFQMLFPVPCIFIVSLIFAFRIDKLMGMILCAVLVVISIICGFIMHNASPIFKKLQKELDRMSKVLLENITGVRVIRAFNKEAHEEERLCNEFRSYAKTAIKVNKQFAMLDGISFFAINISLYITKLISKKTLEASSERQEGLSSLTGIVEEYYTGRDVIRAYNHETESIKTVNNAVDNLRMSTRKADFLQNCVNPLIRLLSRVSQAVIMLIACSWMLKGKMTIGIAQAFFQYINIAAEPLTETSYMINSLQSALASAERTFEFIDAEEEVKDTQTPVFLKNSKGEIAFRNISFGYTPDKILMKNIDFTAKPGQKIAIVGSTGAGKTTLINLLMRFYEVNGGKITIDGIPTTELTRHDLRSNFGMVLQDTWLFGGTIAENIAYGKPDATMEEIKAAAKAAKVDYFIRTMPKGYNALLDNESDNLSVGQRQLITIARVFLCNPPIIILDEATSSVDTRTEMEISLAMKKLMKGRTSFVIAHRLSTIRDADIILFMENGNIVEQGNHKELLKKGGAYATLYYSQFA